MGKIKVKMEKDLWGRKIFLGGRDGDEVYGDEQSGDLTLQRFNAFPLYRFIAVIH